MVLEIEVVEVRGRCPVHKVGDRIVIDGPSVVLNKTDALVEGATNAVLDGLATVAFVLIGLFAVWTAITLFILFMGLL